MNAIFKTPEEIEARSMEIIEELLPADLPYSEKEREILMRLVHTTADPDYAANLRFSEGAVGIAHRALFSGAAVVTDTNMAKAGVSKAALSALGGELFCFMADEDVAKRAKALSLTRAAVSVDKAAELFRGRPLIFAVGNAPTALYRIVELWRTEGWRPELVIGMPVGFVNVVEAKELLMQSGIPYIAAAGRKGGSNVAAAALNALLYQLYDRKTGKLKETRDDGTVYP